MRKLTPIAKMSKKKQRAYHALKRGSWNGLSPVTRIAANKKAYDRKRARRASWWGTDAETDLTLK